MKQLFILIHDNARRSAQQAINLADKGSVVEIKPATRSLEQNSRLWALLTDISKQVEWYGRFFQPEDWKNIFTASLRKQDVVPNIEGNGFVMLGTSTSKMSIQEMIDLQTLIEAFGSERGVKWSEWN